MRKLLLATVGLVALASAAAAQSPGVNSPYNPVWSIPIDSIKRTYALAVGNISPTGVSTDFWQLCGASGVQTKLTQLVFTAKAGAIGPLDVWVIKRSGTDVGGTVFLGPPLAGLSSIGVPYASNIANSKANVTVWTASPSPLGPSVGVLYNSTYMTSNITTGIGHPPLVIPFGNRPAGAPSLLSSTECIDVNLSGGAAGGTLIDITAEWTEE